MSSITSPTSVRRKALEAELEQLANQERQEKEDAVKEKNFQRFMNRPEEYLVGRAHADVGFVGKDYASDRNKPLLPISVSVSGNCGRTYQGEVPLTDASKTYFHNVWGHRQEQEFERRLIEFVTAEVKKITDDLFFTLEIMGLQSNHYYVSEQFFPRDKVAVVQAEIEKAQAEVLDKFSDEAFLEMTKPSGWVSMDTGERSMRVSDLGHSRKILKTYLKNHRPAIFAQLFPDLA